MLVLGIESTAHTFGIGIAELTDLRANTGQILANAKDTYQPRAGWGIIPADARRHHDSVAPALLERALQEARLSLDAIDTIAYSQGPGLPPCLHAGLRFGQQLARANKLPLHPVNHCVAHVEIGRLFTDLQDPVVLYVSGANTQVLSFVDGVYRCFGETQDIGIGNALDKFGRAAGLSFPAGPELEKLAARGSYIPLPYVVKGMDLSFSGIITAATALLRKGAPLRDVAFSLQETTFAMLTEVTERALAHTGKQECILTGGVAANKRLQEMLSIMCAERGARFSTVPFQYAMDNGAMIAWAGALAAAAGAKPVLPARATVKPAQRTDDVAAIWV